MKAWEKELYNYQLTPAPPKMPPQEYIEKYLAEKDEKYFSWYLHYNEKYINEKVEGYVQEYAMQGRFMDMKSAYIFGLLQAFQNYDPEKGASFNSFQAYYTKNAIDDYIRTMRTGYTIPSGDEYALLRKAMALYAKYGYKSDDATINKIALEIGRKLKTTKQMIVGGVRNMMFTEFYRQYADEDGEKGAEDVTVDSTTEPSQMFYHERRLKILYEAFDDLEYRERSIVAEHLGFCENCWSPYYIEIINGRKVKRKFEKIAFIDLAGEHGVVPSSADRIYREAIDKLRKALENDKWL
jgi:RNA polymerase sigma factor (sigma-70 family)